MATVSYEEGFSCQYSTDILVASRSNTCISVKHLFFYLLLVSFEGKQIFLEQLFFKMSVSPYRMLGEMATNEFKSTSQGPVRLSGKTVHKTILFHLGELQSKRMGKSVH